jgi:hypothetical protein
VRNAKGEGAYIIGPEPRPKYREGACPSDQKDPCDWTTESFATLHRVIEENVPHFPLRYGDPRDQALDRLAVLDPDPAQAPEWENEAKRAWTVLAGSSPSFDDYLKSVAGLWRDTGCDVGGAPYVIHGILRIDLSSAALRAALAKSFLNEEHCPGARGLSEEDKAKLREMRGPVPPTPTVQPPTPQQ